jgi:hypothetical protein
MSKKANNFSLTIGIVITLVGFVVFWLPYLGAQKATYSLFFIAGLLYTFLIQESISQEYRDKKKNFLKLTFLVAQHALPPIMVMAQSAILVSIFAKHSDAMEDKDASGNLPGILTAYNTAAFVVLMIEMALLYVYTSKVLREGEHPSAVMRMVEKALTPGFIALGSLGLLFIGLLYTTITRFLTDG